MNLFCNPRLVSEYFILTASAKLARQSRILTIIVGYPVRDELFRQPSDQPVNISFLRPYGVCQVKPVRVQHLQQLSGQPVRNESFQQPLRLASQHLTLSATVRSAGESPTLSATTTGPAVRLSLFQHLLCQPVRARSFQKGPAYVLFGKDCGMSGAG